MDTNWQKIKSRLAEYERKYAHSTAVQLLAASKGQPINRILNLYQEGQRAFGENYLQEALPKIQTLPPDIEWHFIGPIQRNKTKKIAEHFAWVQSIDNAIIAKRLSDQRPAHLPALNICIELNLDNEPTKSGVDSRHVFPLLKYCMTLPRLHVRGLMAIPKPSPIFSEQRYAFHQLFLLFQTLQKQISSLDTLSMGMSDDFEAAVAEGSTMVRIGRALFGARAA